MGDRRLGRNRQFYDAGRLVDKCQADNQPNQDHLTRRSNHHVHTHVQPQYPVATSIHDGGPYCAGHGTSVPYFRQEVLRPKMQSDLR